MLKFNFLYLNNWNGKSVIKKYLKFFQLNYNYRSLKKKVTVLKSLHYRAEDFWLYILEKEKWLRYFVKIVW